MLCFTSYLKTCKSFSAKLVAKKHVSLLALSLELNNKKKQATGESQAATQSDCKEHNTFKYIVAISPTIYIKFISDTYGGRALDQLIRKGSMFYDLLDFGDSYGR